MKLSSAVTVLGTDDPVRVFQQFATLELLSGGRAEIMAGRGSFSGSFPLFMGERRFDYDHLFSERLELLLKLRKETEIQWRGVYRHALSGQGVYPRPVPKERPEDELPVWLAVGGTPESAVRAGQLGLPMALAIIGGMPERFVAFADLYRRAAQDAGNAAKVKLSINSHGFVADTAQQAADTYWPARESRMNRIGRERGWPALTRQSYEADLSPRGALFVGDPEQVAEKILFQHELFGLDRFLLMSVGMLPHKEVLKSIELLGTKVAPIVRDEAARRRVSKAKTPGWQPPIRCSPPIFDRITDVRLLAGTDLIRHPRFALRPVPNAPLWRDAPQVHRVHGELL
ncbi:LLM class flavin-dependent oxidoreductase [Deinococcus fonticola]|uniref:LLM class flavin-dependent oxidoreductase n=1 Tax=Deinococcus fonticola TaxID=2528713 RepID=UPI001F0DCF50|nr:LLM class flavin-dependent oxidoreductase [Deinococcus fonticola]